MVYSDIVKTYRGWRKFENKSGAPKRNQSTPL